MNETERRTVYEFEGYRVDPIKRRLSAGGDSIAITSKAFETLLMLIEKQGCVVSKGELMDAVWENTSVEENNLTQQIAALRRTFGERAGDGRFIVTVPGKGYSFVAAVKEAAIYSEDKPSTEPAQFSRGLFGLSNLLAIDGMTGYAAAAIYIAIVCLAAFLPAFSGVEHRQSVAVLEFRTTDAADKDLGAGIRDTLRAKIGRLPDVALRPQSLPGGYADTLAAGRKVDADVVFSGSIQRDEDRIRVAVEMVDVHSKRVVWGATFDYDDPNRFAAQDRIAAEIIKALGQDISMADVSHKRSLLSV